MTKYHRPYSGLLLVYRPLPNLPKSTLIDFRRSKSTNFRPYLTDFSNPDRPQQMTLLICVGDVHPTRRSTVGIVTTSREYRRKAFVRLFIPTVIRYRSESLVFGSEGDMITNFVSVRVCLSFSPMSLGWRVTFLKVS